MNSAIAGGPAAIQALVNTPQSNPEVARQLLNHATVTDSTTISGPGVTQGLASPLGPVSLAVAPTALAAASYCWRAESHQVTISSFGVNLGWSRIEIYSWCGNGSSITSNNGAAFSAWAGAIYCLANINRNYGWLQYPAWIHGRSAASLGGGVKGACQGFQTMNATMRVAANGYYDYNY